MTSAEVTSLIKFLKKNCVTIINGQTKLSVTPLILQEINNILHSVKEDIFASDLTTTSLVHKYANNKNDLMFLYEFIKKTPKLKISNAISSQNFLIDVSDFTNLKYLELYKFNVSNVKGKQFLRENLEMVVCSRCLDKIGDLLLNCQTDGNTSIWSKLKHAILSRNNLVSLDQSFIYTPWLQYLDLSYNHLTDLNELKCLSNLTHLNASYNNLTSVPKFSLNKLKILLLSNNFICDISGITKLVNLQDLDLSSNCITEHVILFPLSDLPCLLSLNVSKNPISYHPMHRSITSGYLHENVANEYFLLDGHLLSSSEKEFIKHSYKSVHPVSNNPEQKEKIIVEKKIPKKVSTAVIAERLQEFDENHVDQNISNSASLEGDFDEHTKIKKELEDIRKKYGEDKWLHSEAAFLVQSILGIGDSSVSSAQSLEVSERSNETSLTHLEIDESTEVSNPSQNIDTEQKLDDSEKYIVSNDSEIVTSEEFTNEYKEDMVSDKLEDSATEYENYSNDTLWLVQKIVNNEKLNVFLVLKDNEIKELDPIKVTTITQWSLDCVERCMKISTDPLIVQLSFNTIKRNDRIRKYIMEFADAQKLIEIIEQEIEARPLNAPNETVLRCMKCNLVYPQLIPKRISDIKNQNDLACPSCSSNAVIEEELVLKNKTCVNSSSLLNNNSQNILNDSVEVTESPSLSSIGSATSLDRSSEILNNNESHVSYQESDIEIISNPSQSSIEVLEVHSRFENNSITVPQKLHAKMSSSSMNETSTMLPSIVNSQLLTESSSSGSMTDSICTTYETNYHPSRTHRISQSTVEEVLQEESSVETSPEQRHSVEKFTSPKNNDILNNKINEISASNYVSVLEDVLQTVSSKISLATLTTYKSSELKNSSSDYEYSYTDFSLIDHRIKLYLWDQIVPDNEEMFAFIKINLISKMGSPSLLFPGLLVLTDKKMYIMKITKEEIENSLNSENPSNWLQNFDSISTNKIKQIEPLFWKQGFSVEYEDQSTENEPVMKYIMLLYDETRTDNFLSFIKDLGSVHVQSQVDCSISCLNRVIDADDTVQNFVMSDLITTRKKNEEIGRYDLVGLITTNSDLIIIKGEIDWLLTNSCNQPTIILKESISNLVNFKVSENSIILEFFDEATQTESSWVVRTVSSDTNRLILESFKEPWEELFGIQIPLIK